MSRRIPTEPAIARNFNEFVSRRQLFVATGGLLLSSGVLTLVGCGGSGSGSRSGGPTGGFISMKKFGGSVSVPAGVDSAKLVVGAGLNTSKLVAGGFNLTAPADAPSLVSVVVPSSKSLLFMGMFDPTAPGKMTIDSRSTAVALLFFALGGSTMTRDGMKPLLDAINASSATATFASVVTARISASPFAAGSGDSQIVSALATAARAIAPSIANNAVAARPADEPTLLSIAPSGEVDGVTFVQAQSGTGFAVQNAKRRLGYAYTYFTEHVDATGTKTPVNPPTQVGGVLEIPSTSSLLKLGSGWNLVTSATVPLALEGTDSQSIYSLVYLTQVYGASTPSFFGESMWAAELPKWNASLAELGQESFISYFANIILSGLGLGGLTWGHVTLAGCIAQLKVIPGMSVLIERAAGSDVLLGDLVKASLQEFLQGDIKQAILKDMGILVRSASAEAAAILEAGATTAAALSVLEVAISALLAAGAILLAADLAAVAIDTTFGEKGDLWTATVVKQILKLSPQNPNAKPGDRVHFAVVPPTGLKGALQYDWTQTSAFATLSAADGTVGNKITTSSTSVDLVTTGSDTQPISVTVVGYEVSGAVRTEFGRAQTTVSFKTTVTSGQVVQTDAFVSNNVENIWVWGIYTFTPEVGQGYKVSDAANEIALVTAAELAGGAPVWIATQNPNDSNSLTQTTAYGGYSSPYAFPDFFYNMGGGKVGVPVYRAILDDASPYSDMAQKISEATDAANAEIARITLFPYNP